MRLVCAALICFLAATASAGDQVRPGYDPETGWILHQGEHPNPNAAYKWMHIMQEASGRSVDRVGARPTIISREMHIAMTAMYDAWAAYDEKAVGTRLGAMLRRPAAERTPENKAKAIAYAVYRALLDLYPEDSAWLAEQMRADGHDPNDATTVASKPQGVGNTVAGAVLAYRRHDGANRAMGGYHIPTDNHVGLEVGRQIAEYSWPKYQAYFDGTATPRY